MASFGAINLPMEKSDICRHQVIENGKPSFAHSSAYFLLQNNLRNNESSATRIPNENMDARSAKGTAMLLDSLDQPQSKLGRNGKRGRKATSCTQCHLRKQACDRHQPCRRCVHRGVAHLCKASSDNLSRDLKSSHETPDAQIKGSLTGTAETTRRNATVISSPKLGQLCTARGARSFYGTSYFGHQVAARILQEESPDLQSGIPRGPDSLRSLRDESSPFSQVWDLFGLLPRQKSAADSLVTKFFAEVNWCLDAVNEQNFMTQYNDFWAKGFGFDDLAAVDIRWLALLFIILAFGSLIEGSCKCPKDVQKDYEEASLRFYVSTILKQQEFC